MSATAVSPPSYAGDAGRGVPSRLRGLWRGPSRDPAWARPALLALLAVTALLYLFNLSRNGYANDFYAAAVQAGTKSWKAFFFGSFDASNFITVDKTPASLWMDEIFARVFGFSSWTLLVPQALEGMGAVWLLYVAVKRWFGPGAAVAAGAVFALTPAAALIFRFNNPDALLTLLMVASAYCVQRSVERPRGAARWLVVAGLLLGFAFLAKMLQAFLVLPGFALAYLVAAPVRLPRRIWHVLAGGVAVIVGAGWWVAAAQLWPAGSRPYFGGSTNNNILELTLGYNGLGRLDGTETGSIGFNGSSVGGAGGGGNFGGSTGIFRLFQSEFGGQVSWLIPAALIALAALLWVVRPRRTRAAASPAVLADTGEAGALPGGPAGFGRVSLGRVSLGRVSFGRARGGRGPGTAARVSGPAARMRAFAAIWGGWLLVTGLVFSFMQGIIHPYYMVALGPAIGALVGVGATALWQARVSVAGRVTAAVAVGVTAWWSYELLDRTPSWLPWLRWVVLLAGGVAVLALAAAAVVAREQRLAGPGAAGLDLDGQDLDGQDAAGLDAAGLEDVVGQGPAARRMPAWRLPAWSMTAAGAVATGAALVAGLAGPLAYTLDTVNSTHTGSIPSAGPTVTGAFGGAGGPGGGAGRGFAGAGGARTGTGGNGGGGFGGGGFAGTGNGTGTGTGTGNGTGTGTGNGTGNGTGSPAAGNGTGTGTGNTPGFRRRGAGGTQGGFGGAGGTGRAGGAGGGFNGGGGLSGSTTVSSALIKLIETDSSKYRWIAATEGTQEAAPIELATGGLAVVAIGGFNGSDPSPTLAQFESMVAAHEIHYYVGQGANSFGGSSVSSAISSWVAAHYTAQTVGGSTVYDLTKPAS
ncbi:MAG TPA: glycosyltransferase family 39 protein [Trebonia sp.]